MIIRERVARCSRLPSAFGGDGRSIYSCYIIEGVEDRIWRSGNDDGAVVAAPRRAEPVMHKKLARQTFGEDQSRRRPA